MRLYFIIFILIETLHAQPSWVNNPNMDGYITGVGMSNDQNQVSKRRIATVAARANLAETIKVQLKSYFKMITTTHNATLSTFTESTIEQQANELLVQSFIKDTFQDADGTFYVLMVIKKNI